MQKLDISAIVVGYNEESLLASCLSSICFCKEILFFDLGSRDNSVRIASDHGAIIHHHEKVLSCEWIHTKFATKTTYEWVLIIDPDEVVDKNLEVELRLLFERGIDKSIGAIKVPWLFYFKGRRLNGTPWGGINTRILLVNNQRFVFTPHIHVGRKVLPGFHEKEIHNPAYCVHHFWMRNFSMLLEKHRRYLKNEGKARINEGLRTNVFKIVISPFVHFYYSYVSKRGYSDKWTGLGLSIFWAWYQTAASLQLYKLQNKTKYPI